MSQLVINPSTGRKIKIGSGTYKRLVREGLLGSEHIWILEYLTDTASINWGDDEVVTLVFSSKEAAIQSIIAMLPALTEQERSEVAQRLGTERSAPKIRYIQDRSTFVITRHTVHQESVRPPLRDQIRH